MSNDKVGTVQSEATHDVRVLTFKADMSGVITSNAGVIDDDYIEFYRIEGMGGLIEPPYNLKRLEELVVTNNTLGPCIAAMVANIDGTGYELERRDGEKMTDADWSKVKPAFDFFDECWPLTSFDTLRKKVRRDLEATGNGYMEVIRNPVGEIVFVGHLESKLMRLARLDGPTVVTEKVKRRGSEINITRQKRERRFAQKLGEKLTWFAEYGASRKLDKFTGLWESDTYKVKPENVATEVIHLKVDPDITTPYGIPRWIAQIPSVLASRQAEEHNLEYFVSGGVPPYLVIVQGGQLAEKAVDALRDALNQKGANARIQVIEAFAAQGSLDSSSNVQVKVERFGSTERSGDSMSAQFDKDCEARVRKSFRLPPLLIGNSDDINFASAHASYLVAEAQVFRPERDEFDEVVSSTILPSILGSRDYIFRSKPISIVDAATKLSAVQMAISTNRVDPEQTLILLGEIAGVVFSFTDEETPTTFVPPVVKEAVAQANAQQGGNNVVPIKSSSKDKQPAAKYDTSELSDLIGCTLAVMNSQSPFGMAHGQAV